MTERTGDDGGLQGPGRAHVTGATSQSASYLASLGVPDLAPLTYPFDPGYDAGTVEGHLAQSGHLMAGFKLSMASWQLAAPGETSRKVRAAAGAGVPVVTGGGPFEVAVEAGRLEDYLALCSSIGVERIEAGQGFTRADLDPADIVKQAEAHHLGVQFELGAKHEGHFDRDQVDALVTLGKRWLDAGAACLVVEARESAQAVGLFDDQGRLNTALADRLVEGLGLESLVFEAPDKRSQFALLDHLGRQACLSNVRLEEVLRVEIYRRGLHSDSYDKEGLAFARPRSAG